MFVEDRQIGVFNLTDPEVGSHAAPIVLLRYNASVKLPPPLRLVLSAFLVTAVTSLVWWLVGYQIGKLMVSGADAASFRRSLGLEDGVFLRLALLALVGAVTAVAGGGGKWLPLAGLAFGAALLYPDHEAGAILGVILFVFCAAGVSEVGGALRQALIAGIAAIAISIAFTLQGSFGRSELVVIAILRGLFWFLPLLVLPDLVDRHVLKRFSW